MRHFRKTRTGYMHVTVTEALLPSSQTNGSHSEWSRSMDECLNPRESQVLFGRHNTDGVCVTQASAPALHTNDAVTFLQDTELDRFGDTPLQAAVDVFLPDGGVKVGLLLRE